MRRIFFSWLAILVLAAGCSSEKGGSVDQSERKELTVYSGRGQDLVEPIIKRFEKSSGIKVRMRYGGTAELAATILEEGEGSPADIFFAQDAGALGAVEKAGLFRELPEEITGRVGPEFRSKTGKWVGITGRVRTVVYNTERVNEAALPPSILDFTNAKWKDKIGWAPTNGSFQAFVTALRKLRGEEVAKKWLQEVKDNGARSYENNVQIIKAVSAGEIEVGFVNHYYAVQLKAEDPALKAANYFYRNGDPGGLVNAAGIGILGRSKRVDSAESLTEYLLSQKGQQYWAGGEFEYPLVPEVKAAASLPSLEDLNAPDIDLSNLNDLESTLKMIENVGLL